MVNKQPKRIAALQRAMTVLEAIGAADGGMRLQDLAQAAGLTAGAVHHIVDTLAADGYVVRTTKPVRYHLGPALYTLLARRGQRRLISVCSEEMIVLQKELGRGNVSFCEAVGQELLLSRQVTAERPELVREPERSVLPPYTSAASVVHLAWWPEERAASYRELRPFSVYGSGLWKTETAWRKVLAQVRKQGYVDLPLAETHFLRIGVPVLRPDGALAASLTISVHGVEDLEDWRQKLIAVGLATTQRIQQRLKDDQR